jgi:magnesium transporter
MLTFYARSVDGRTERAPGVRPETDDFVWADLHQPSGEEESAIEARLGLNVPTPAEREAIEESARFYEECGALVLTATLLGQRSEGPFVAEPVSFILKEKKLVTVRTIKPRAFEIGPGRSSARIETSPDGAGVFMALLDGVIERMADILSAGAHEAAEITTHIFGPEPQLGGLAALCHDSLSSLHRLVAFAEQAGERHGLARDPFRALRRDIEELERTADAQQARLSFLLEAALGLVGAAQNNALKALAIATIAFAPPTLIASIFGMNFKAMSWFERDWGPWAAAGLMLAAPAALFAIARWRRWF